MACTCETCCKNYETCKTAHLPCVDTQILAENCKLFEHKYNNQILKGVVDNDRQRDYNGVGKC